MPKMTKDQYEWFAWSAQQYRQWMIKELQPRTNIDVVKPQLAVAREAVEPQAKPITEQYMEQLADQQRAKDEADAEEQNDLFRPLYRSRPPRTFTAEEVTPPGDWNASTRRTRWDWEL